MKKHSSNKQQASLYHIMRNMHRSNEPQLLQRLGIECNELFELDIFDTKFLNQIGEDSLLVVSVVL